VIGIVFKQVFVDAVEARLGDLRPGGVIEKDGGAIQGWELLADEVNVVCGHDSSLID
jgi:hypothetical protein